MLTRFRSHGAQVSRYSQAIDIIRQHKCAASAPCAEAAHRRRVRRERRPPQGGSPTHPAVSTARPRECPPDGEGFAIFEMGPGSGRENLVRAFRGAGAA